MSTKNSVSREYHRLTPENCPALVPTPRIRFVVVDECALCYVSPVEPNECQFIYANVLSAPNRGVQVFRDGDHITLDFQASVRLATVEDFADYRIHLGAGNDGYNDPKFYEPIPHREAVTIEDKVNQFTRQLLLGPAADLIEARWSKDISSVIETLLCAGYTITPPATPPTDLEVKLNKTREDARRVASGLAGSPAYLTENSKNGQVVSYGFRFHCSEAKIGDVLPNTGDQSFVSTLIEIIEPKPRR